MNFREEPLHHTRRHFFQHCGIGLGSIALGSLFYKDGAIVVADDDRRTNPLAPRPPHYTPKAKRVIFLFMAGGPSQLELFDYKPKLLEFDGKVIPESYVTNKRFAFLKRDAKLMGTWRQFRRYGSSGQEIGTLLPHLGSIADDITLIKSMTTDVFNHGPAKFFMNTGSPRFGFPSMGSWVTYGIGSKASDLPGFIVLQSGPRGPRGGSVNWGSGFLPTTYQGVPFRGKGDAILNLSSPRGIDSVRQKNFVDAVNNLNRVRLGTVGDPEIETRIASYEMAYRMQASAPDLMDISSEPRETLELYGADPATPSFAKNCLLARRLVERGVRFVQLYHTDGDHHGSKGNELDGTLEDICLEVDRPCAALVKDLKRRGLLDDTLVIWGGEFGRTPQAEPRQFRGRDHHIEAYTMWLAGGGARPGTTIGKTDDLGYYTVEDRVHVHDLQATILHLLGFDHLKLTYRFQGRDFRLTDVGGEIVEKLLA